MAPQQFLHTQPDSGSSRMALQTAHCGPSSADTTALPACLRSLGIRDLGLGISAATRVTHIACSLLSARLQRLDKSVQHLSYGFCQVDALQQQRFRNEFASLDELEERFDFSMRAERIREVLPSAMFEGIEMPAGSSWSAKMNRYGW
jgi:hypothetical protein